MTLLLTDGITTGQWVSLDIPMSHLCVTSFELSESIQDNWKWNCVRRQPILLESTYSCRNRYIFERFDCRWLVPLQVSHHWRLATL